MPKDLRKCAWLPFIEPKSSATSRAARSWVLLAVVALSGGALAGCEETGDGTAEEPSSLLPDSVGGSDTVEEGGDVVEPIEYDDPYEGEAGGYSAIFDASSPELFDFPFPSDLRRSDAGVIDLTGYPNPNEIPLVQWYVDAAEKYSTGYSPTGAMYVRFDEPVESLGLPSVLGSVGDNSPVWLLDASEGSPTYGQRVPVEAVFYEEGGSLYWPERTLGVRPAVGVPLRESSEYALVIRRSLRSDSGDLLEPPEELVAALFDADDADASLADCYAPLRALSAAGHLNPYEVGVATVFTTGNFTQEFVRVRDHVRQQAPPPLSQWTELDDEEGYVLLEARYSAPNFQFGDKPYTESGGGLEFGDAGQPLSTLVEPLRLALAIPKGPVPPGGYPIVFYAHGFGGNYRTFTAAGRENPAELLTDAGLAVLSIDEPLHGIRYNETDDIELLVFNVLNPEAGRTNFRQAAFDWFWLIRMAKAGIQIPGDLAPTGQAHTLDGSRLGFIGHSHGGIAGAMLAAVEPDIQTYILSGAGGGLTQTLLLRKDPVDFEAFIGLSIQEPVEWFDGLHPVLSLVQMVVDATDPINYAPYLATGELRGGAPVNCLITSGLSDPLTPSITTSSLASAAKIPVLAPLLEPSDGLDWVDTAPVSLPVASNMTANDGSPATMALYQNGNHGHFVIFDEAEAARLYSGLLSSAAYGTATLE